MFTLNNQRIPKQAKRNARNFLKGARMAKDFRDPASVVAARVIAALMTMPDWTARKNFLTGTIAQARREGMNLQLELDKQEKLPLSDTLHETSSP